MTGFSIATAGRGLAMGALALTVVLGSACGSSVPAPRSIRLGDETCATCRQVIGTLDAAAQVVHVDGTTRVYDDLGCLATDSRALRGGGQFYVQFSGGRGWVPVEEVHFALQPDRPSPRGYHYFAYTEDEARHADVDHWARGWDDVVRTLNAR